MSSHLKSVSLLALGAAMGVSASVASAEQINFSTYIPASERAIVDGFIPLFDKVAEETNGALTVQIFTAGQMFGPVDTLPGIQSGAVQGGTVFATFYANELPYSAFMHDTAAINTDRIASVGASLEVQLLNCPGCESELERAGIMTLGGHALAPYMLICSIPVNSVADLAGKRIRASTGVMATAVNLMGANGVNIAFGEISQAFERGNLDCMIGNQSWMTLFGITELVQTTIPEPTLGIVPSTTFLSFDLATWQGWSDEIKESFRRNVPTYLANTTLSYLAVDEAAVDAAVAAGMVEVDLGEDMEALRDSLVEAERSRILADARTRGIADPEGLLATYEATYAKWVDLAAEIDGDAARFAEVLYEEIYSKLEF